jgi:hypothetical protein
VALFHEVADSRSILLRITTGKALVGRVKDHEMLLGLRDVWYCSCQWIRNDRMRSSQLYRMRSGEVALMCFSSSFHWSSLGS